MDNKTHTDSGTRAIVLLFQLVLWSSLLQAVRLVGRILTQRQTNKFSKWLSDYLRCIMDLRAGGCLMGVQWWTLRGGGSLAYRTLAGGGVSNTATLTHVCTHKETNKNTYKYNYSPTHTQSHTSHNRRVQRPKSSQVNLALQMANSAKEPPYHLCTIFVCVPLLLRVSSKWCEVFQNIFICLPQGPIVKRSVKAGRVGGY